MSESRRVGLMRAIFGLRPSSRSGAPPVHAVRDGAPANARPMRLPRLAALVDSALPEGGVALITGASGAGKSRLLRAVAARLGPDAVWVRPELPGHARELAPVDLISGTLSRATGVLAAAGLADAHVLVTPSGLLSEGQRARLCIAVAFADAQAGARGSALLIDEFTSGLDRVTARTLASGLARWAARSGLRVFVATSHDDVLEALAPAVCVAMGLDRGVEVSR